MFTASSIDVVQCYSEQSVDDYTLPMFTASSIDVAQCYSEQSVETIHCPCLLLAALMLRNATQSTVWRLYIAHVYLLAASETVV